MNGQFRQIIKKEFAHIDNLYFNSAYFGPSPYRAKQKVANALFKELDPSFFDYLSWFGVSDRIRRAIGNLISVDYQDIAFTTSTSDTNNIVANGFPFKDGDVVCTLDKEYPSNTIPYMLAEKNRGIKLQLLDPMDYNVDAISNKIDPKTKVFVISHVAFNTGRKIDISAIGKFLRERDILFIVDCTQSLGGIYISPEEMEYIDILACSLYKWMLGPYGSAFAYFSKNAQEKIQHKSLNWLNTDNSKNLTDLLNYNINPLPGARKYDRGQTPNMLAMSCIEAGLEVIKELGLQNIEAHNARLRNFFIENFPKNKYDLVTPPGEPGNIICVKGKGIDTTELELELKSRQIDVSNREGNLRLSFHLFNSLEQVETLVEAMDI